MVAVPKIPPPYYVIATVTFPVYTALAVSTVYHSPTKSMKKIIRSLKSRTQSSRLTRRPASILSHGYANLPDLPTEILLQILSYCITPTPLRLQPFWLLDVTPHVLLSPNHNTVEPSEQHLEQVRMANILSLVCRRTWSVFAPSVWSQFRCSNPMALTDLTNACTSGRELGSYVQ